MIISDDPLLPGYLFHTTDCRPVRIHREFEFTFADAITPRKARPQARRRSVERAEGQRWKRLSPLTRKTRKMTGTALITRLWVLFGLWHASFPSKDVYAARGCFNRVEETSRVTQLSLSSVTPTLSPLAVLKYHLSFSLSFLPRQATHFAIPLVSSPISFFDNLAFIAGRLRRMHKCRSSLRQKCISRGAKERSLLFWYFYLRCIFLLFATISW